jgi:hypothetical protein
MNKKMMPKNVGHLRRLWPLPYRFDAQEGVYLPQEDDPWRVERLCDNEEKLILLNLRTYHVYDLYFDNIIEFRNPDRFILKSQLTLSGRYIFEEPLFRPPES